MNRDLIMSAWRERFGRALPEKIICVGLNYRDHAAEQGVDLPQEPLLFGKFPNALLDPGGSIVLPRGIGHVDSEAELAVVIGRQARNVDVADALEVVEGYVCANDVSARDLQFKDGQWLRAKGFDTFCPISTELVPVEQVGDGRGLRVVQRLNGDGHPGLEHRLDDLRSARDRRARIHRLHPRAGRPDPHRHAGRSRCLS